MSSIVRTALLTSLTALAVVGAGVLFVEYGPKSIHHDEPIIIDNGPTKIRVLPAWHWGSLRDLDPDEGSTPGGKSWRIEGKHKFSYLKILPNSNEDCNGTNAVCTTLANPTITVDFVDKQQNPAGATSLAWSSPAGTEKGEVLLSPVSSNDYRVRWNNKGGTISWHKLEAKDKDEKYRVRSVTYYPGQNAVTWTHQDSRNPTDVLILLCVANTNCTAKGKD